MVAVAGLDNHYKFSRVTFRDRNGRIVRRERLDHTDSQALRRKLAAWPKSLPVVMEASFGWQWLSDVMRAEGLRPQLANCHKVKRWAEAMGSAHTNRKDADLLSLLPLQPTEWWRVWAAPPTVRQRREWTRLYADLRSAQTQWKNRIHGVFHRHGLFHEFSDLFGVAGRAYLAELCRDGGGVLADGALAALRSSVRMLQAVRQELSDILRMFRKQIQANPQAIVLRTMPGFGPILTLTVLAEIGEPSRFRSHGALASYAGLAPISRDTGEDESPADPKGRKLRRRCNRTLKWALITAARAAVRKGGRWRASFDRYTAGGKRRRNRGYIKVAREMVTVVHAILRDGRPYSDAPPARPAGIGRHPLVRERAGSI